MGFMSARRMSRPPKRKGRNTSLCPPCPSPRSSSIARCGATASARRRSPSVSASLCRRSTGCSTFATPLASMRSSGPSPRWGEPWRSSSEQRRERSPSRAASAKTSAMNAPLAKSSLTDPISRRRTFAIISHPDAGKTTLTEKLLLFGGAIQLAGAGARQAQRPADALRLDEHRARARHLGRRPR